MPDRILQAIIIEYHSQMPKAYKIQPPLINLIGNFTLNLAVIGNRSITIYVK